MVLVRYKSLSLVDRICKNFPGYEYRSINRRESIPTVFIDFVNTGIQVIRFDLRKTSAFQAFFEFSEHVPKETRRKFMMVPHAGTGWLGFVANESDQKDIEEKVTFMMMYWNKCIESIKTGEVGVYHKTESRMVFFARKAYRDEFPVCNRKAIKEMPVRPDIYFMEKGLIIEVDGAQHFRYIKHFHKNEGVFKGQKERDRKLNEWCISNRISILHIVESAAAHIESSIHFRELCEEAISLFDVCYLVMDNNTLKLLSTAEFTKWNEVR